MADFGTVLYPEEISSRNRQLLVRPEDIHRRCPNSQPPHPLQFTTLCFKFIPMLETLDIHNNGL